MKHLIFILTVIFIGLFINGCDSPTESKATPVNEPVLLAPNDNQSNVSLTPNFKWENAGNIIQIDYNNTFNPPAIYNYDGLNGVSEFSLPGGIITENGKTFYWRIGAVTGNSTTWSTATFKFTTLP